MARKWVCPICSSTTKGPDRPRRNASMLYCFECSEKRGVLVRRQCPSLEEKRKRTKSRRVKRKTRASEKRRTKWDVEGIDVRVRLAEIMANPFWSNIFDQTGPAAMSVRWSTAYPDRVTGSARDWEWSFSMTIGVNARYPEVEETMIHELAHLVAGCHEGHSEFWRKIFKGAVSEIWGVQIEGTSSSALDLAAEESIARVYSSRV